MTSAWNGALGGSAVGGSAVGVLAGTYGAVCGVLAGKGKARTFVLGCHAILLLLGAAALLTGLVALLREQPFHVYFPLLLGGGILTSVLRALLPVVRRAYAQADQRRLQAEAIRRGGVAR